MASSEGLKKIFFNVHSEEIFISIIEFFFSRMYVTWKIDFWGLNDKDDDIKI